MIKFIFKFLTKTIEFSIFNMILFGSLFYFKLIYIPLNFNNFVFRILLCSAVGAILHYVFEDQEEESC
jgi:hypothetical protein